MRVVPVPCLADNYAYLVVCERSGQAAVVDPGEVAPVIEAVERERVRLAAIWCTHHHADHVGGNPGLLERWPGLEVVGHAHDAGRIAGLTRAVEDGAVVELGELRATILHNPGHTLGAISYHVAGGALFTGDTLFLAGCGRLFEGTAAQMQASLARLAALPGDTQVYCGHEYTESNLAFAAAVEPDNPAVQERRKAVRAARAAGRPSVPSSMLAELTTNPFLRVGVPAVVAAARTRSPDVGDAVSVFAALRGWKDVFRA